MKINKSKGGWLIKISVRKLGRFLKLLYKIILNQTNAKREGRAKDGTIYTQTTVSHYLGHVSFC